MFNKLGTFARENIDKLLHYIVSQIIFVTIYIGILYYFEFSQLISVLGAASITFIIGVLKEIYDYVSGTGNAELLDVIANVLGISILVIVILL